MTEPYDSRPDTLAHIDRVATFLNQFAAILQERALVHDKSKLMSPEVDAFDVGTPALHGLTYGSPEYFAQFKASGMEAGLLHHWRHNSHHPEFDAFSEDGVLDEEAVKDGTAVSRMSLFDIIEMTTADWPAAVLRHADGDLRRSLEVNRERFGLSDQLVSIIRNTWVEMGLIPVVSG